MDGQRGRHLVRRPGVADGGRRRERLGRARGCRRDRGRRAQRAGVARIDVVDSHDHALDRIDKNPAYPGFHFESVRTTTFLWGDVVIRRYAAD